MAHQTAVVLLLILGTAATALAESEGYRQCEFGWKYYDGRCFIYKGTAMDWASAEKHCLNLGAHLISIHSENEYQLIKALIRAHDAEENPTWIGLTGCQKRNNFFWSDGTKLTFTKWNPGEPNFQYGECCVHMNWSGSKNWNDIPCDRTYPFVCAMSVN
ncbi:hypothetical protein PHYPO_G00190070 [Pangasianodon hypophthalmus]|uniref:C-type lectin domain-containing protein n=1 Tax=Pangasianodon hypophthalmus TaxID=310915 RepID=A0A5N5PK03_PANHP|nr:lactose-binding lectin l-2 isoform X2 [Pangasianodon hypophthalmus]KAB5579036.1 hypothetical protein PHYPO_G00190070 [Pangasianodon hypophthalmus]